MFGNYVNYSFLFFKIWGMNKLLLGVPYYIVEHLILSNILKVAYSGGKMIITGIGSGIYYLAFPKPVEVIMDNKDDEIITNQNNEIYNTMKF